jgi:hypothetical protein
MKQTDHARNKGIVTNLQNVSNNRVHANLKLKSERTFGMNKT